MWRRMLLVAARFVRNAAAFLFALVASLVTVLCATGSLDRARAEAVVALLRGGAEAVAFEELADLRRARAELESRRREAPEHTIALRVAEEAAEREARRGGAALSGRVLEVLARELERREAEVDARIGRWETARKAFEAERLAELGRRQAAALTRVRKIISNFDADLISASYQQKYTGASGPEAERARREVIEDFRLLREPFVTEILSAFTGADAPRLRMEILEQLKKPG